MDAEKTAQSFLVNGSLELNEDENNEGLDTAVQIMVQVDAYQTLNRPVIDTRWTRGITNYAMIYFLRICRFKKDRLNAADSLFYGEQDGRIRFMSIKITLMP